MSNESTELYPMPSELEILKLLLSPGYRIRLSGDSEERSYEGVVDSRGVRMQTVYSGFVARAQKHGLIEVINGSITYTDYGLSKRGRLLASGRNGNEPSLPNKAASHNEPQLGGFRRVLSPSYKRGNKMPQRIIKVVGVSHEGRQSILAKMAGDEDVMLVAEPENPFDSHAIAVHALIDNDTYQHIGYIKRELASELGGLMANGQRVECRIKAITGGFDLPNGEIANYGLEIVVVLPDTPDGDGVVECDDCLGTGKDGFTGEPCEECNGDGTIECYACEGGLVPNPDYIAPPDSEAK